ncbi:MAG TPA: DUF1569 domain-containing protein [Gemmatimonadales bacterium]|nr:DUF1569 domain-containing protein [Gemmatimonadales bacterium]
MPTIENPEARAAIVARLRTLNPGSQPKWGTLTAPRLLCHLADQLRVALGDIPSKPRGNWLTHSLIKWLAIDTPMQAPPGKVRTVPEMMSTLPSTWEADLHACEELLDRLARARTVAPHPAFGPLSRRAWSRLAWKHLDHHLRQFGA